MLTDAAIKSRRGKYVKPEVKPVLSEFFINFENFLLNKFLLYN